MWWSNGGILDLTFDAADKLGGDGGTKAKVERFLNNHPISDQFRKDEKERNDARGSTQIGNGDPNKKPANSDSDSNKTRGWFDKDGNVNQNYSDDDGLIINGETDERPAPDDAGG